VLVNSSFGKRVSYKSVKQIACVQPHVFWQRWYFTCPLRFDFVYYTQLVFTSPQLVYTEKQWALSLRRSS